jgi:hypothetical protein
MAGKANITRKPNVFAYIIRTVGAGYRLKGFVPWVSRKKVFFGACKKNMRPNVKRGDYIMGISGSAAGNPRRVILWMRVSETMTFRQAYERGKTDETFRAVRGTAIHVRPRRLAVHFPGDPEGYEHIHGAHHSDDWRADVRGKRDVFLVGGKYSWVIESDEAPEVTEELVELLKEGIHWRGNATIHNPLTEHAVGKHACVTGRAAQQVITWLGRVRRPVEASRPRTASVCNRTCACN